MDFYLPPEACSYRMAIVSIKKTYKGQAKRTMMAVWSYLKQFSYTKWIVVVDHYIDVRNLKDVIWASVASGTNACDMIISPCSMKTLGLLAHACAINLMIRAAEVTLKEKKRLVLKIDENSKVKIQDLS